MKKNLLLLLLMLLSVAGYSHVWEIRVNQAQDGTLTWYLQSYHTVSECGIGNSGLVINGVQYPIQQIFSGSAATQSPTVFAVNGNDIRASYATITTPFLGTTLSVFPYSNNVCWANLVQGTGTFTPPPPPVCTSCPLTGWSNTTGVASNNGTPCNPADDILPATITVNHLSCGSITGDGKFSVVFNSQTYGPFNYSSGITTTVNLNLPYGTTNSSQVNVVDSDFPCNIQHGLTVPGGQFNGVGDATAPVIACPSNISVPATNGQCNAVVNFAATATDNCTASPIITYSHVPGSTFPVGTTLVTVTAKDALNNTSNCSFNVTVTDNQNPIISGPANITVNATAGNCGANVMVPTATTNNSCLTGWSQTMPIQVSSANSSALTDYQVKVVLNTQALIAAGNMQANGADIRFNDASCTPLNYWIESGINTNNTIIWVKVPSIPANGSTTITMNYGNATAAAASNGTNTFILFDDFEDGNTTGWSFGSGTWSVVNHAGGKALNITNAGFGNGAAAVLAQSLPTNEYVVETDYMPLSDGSYGGPLFEFDNFNQYYAIHSMPDIDVVMHSLINNFADYGMMWNAPHNANTWINFRIERSPSANKVYFNHAFIDDLNQVFSNGAGLWGYAGPSNFDNFRVRKFATSVPTVTPGSGSSFSVTDNCGIATIVNNRNNTSNASGFYPVGTTTVNWTVTDVHGRTANASQTITVVDNIAPVIACPANVTLPCSLSTAPAIAGTATATDNCGTANVSFTDVSSKSANPASPAYYNYTITRTWKATDANNNFSTCNQTINVNDNVAPSITCPASVTVSCNASTAPSATGTASGSDNCSSVNITFSDVSTKGSSQLDASYYNYTITRTWKATDVTGNFTTCAQVITVQDVTPPVLTLPANTTVNCQDNKDAISTGLASGADCSPVANWYTDVTTQDLNAANAGHYNYVITRTWFSRDVSNNVSQGDQIITVQDVTAPTASCPAAVTVACNASTAPSATGVATGSDNCSPLTITHSDVSTQDANAGSAAHYNYSITRTWKVADASGNFNTCTQVINVEDVTAPSISVPASVTINCQDATTTAANGTAAGSDNCSAVAISYTDNSTQDANATNAGHYNYSITRTWKAMDVTGNFTTGVQTITVQDVTAPSISTPASVTLNCQDDNTPANTGSATGSDNCSAVAVSYTDNNTQDANPANAGHYNYSITRTWKSMDVTGNFTTGVQTITVQDVTAPSISTPASVTLNCQDDNTPANTGSATGSDNCSAVAISYTDNSTQNANASNAGHYNYTITRTWKSMDVTGNFTTGVQTITVQDVTAPSLNVPASVTVNCQDDKTPGTRGTATGTDNCSEVAISYSDVSTQNANANNAGHYNYTITRTWKSMDVTGNYTTGVQTITVQDVTAPSVTCPADATVSCKTSVSDNGSATGTDNCSPVAISHSDNSTQDANPANAGHYSYTITRTWTATDVTGNSSNCAQVITVNALNNAAIAVNPVNTINANHPNHTIYIGYGPQSVTLTASALGGVGAHSYSWAPTTGVANPNSASTSVAPTTTTTYTVTITDGTGCSITKSVTINVVDVRCGNNNNKVKVCHIPPGNNSNPQNLCIASSAVATHLAHGCKLGDCPGAKNGSYEEEDEHMGGLVVNEVKVYPNPNNGSFTIELPTGMEQASIAVLDMAGKVIVKQVANGSKVQVDLGSVARAMYMVNVTNGSEVFRTKVSVQ